MKLSTATEEQKQDLLYVLSAISEEGECVLEHASKKSLSEASFVNAIMDRDYNAYPYISDELKDDEVISLKAVEKNPKNLKFASENIQNNLKVVLKAVKKNGLVLEYANKRLKNNKTVVDAAILSDPLAIGYAGEIYRSDRELGVQLLKRNLMVYEYLSDKLKGDLDIASIALGDENDLGIYNYKKIPKEIRKSPEIINKLITLKDSIIQNGEDVSIILGIQEINFDKKYLDNQFQKYPFIVLKHQNYTPSKEQLQWLSTDPIMNRRYKKEIAALNIKNLTL